MGEKGAGRMRRMVQGGEEKEKEKEQVRPPSKDRAAVGAFGALEG